MFLDWQLFFHYIPFKRVSLKKIEEGGIGQPNEKKNGEKMIERKDRRVRF